jgi:acetoin utilization deacetylase AcuC-like enzyme
VKVFYSAEYEVSLPGHIWPTSKYRLIADRLADPGRRGPALALVAPTPASWKDLALVHTPEYLAKLRNHTLTAEDIATLELPWMPGMADTFRLMVGGTCGTAAAALGEGVAAHLGGGLHHAFANHGEGFCPLNDVAIALRVLQRDHGVRRAAIVDCDVHHGNGTAMIFERDAHIFTFSIHQQLNYPFVKPRSDLDVGLEDGARDERYLEALAGALPRVFESRPEIIVYLAGADPFERDGLGGLKITKPGLAARDHLVFDTARAEGVAVATVLAGGYAEDVSDTVDIHTATIEAMLEQGNGGGRR